VCASRAREGSFSQYSVSRENVLTMSVTGSAAASRTSPFSRAAAHAAAALLACSIARAMFSAKRSGSLTRYCSTFGGRGWSPRSSRMVMLNRVLRCFLFRNHVLAYYYVTSRPSYDLIFNILRIRKLSNSLYCNVSDNFVSDILGVCVTDNRTSHNNRHVAVVCSVLSIAGLIFNPW